MTFARFTTFLFTFVSALAAQGLHLGIKGGVPLTRVVKEVGGVQPTDWRFTIGPSVEIGLPFSLAIEANALVKRPGYTLNRFSVRDTTLEVPILLKKYYGVPASPARIFIDGGYSFRRGLSSTFAAAESRQNGFVAGSGVQLRLAGFRLSGEGRYTRWLGLGSPITPLNVVRANENQFEVLFGFGF